jgi:cytochrome P450
MFLEEFDAASAQDPRAGTGVLIKWLRNDWQSLYAELRVHRPVLATSLFTLVTRATDVFDILAQPSLYSVRASRLPMDKAVGSFMLARDETELNWEEKGLLQAVLRWEDLPIVRDLAGRTAKESLEGANGTVDLVPEIARRVPLRIVQQIFGFEAADADMLRWSFATQHGMFRNLPFNEDVLARCHSAGREMQAWLWPFLASRWAAAPLPGLTAVDRLINLSHGAGSVLPPDRVVSNVSGLLVGAIETISAAIVQATDQLLLHPEWLRSALAADQAGDMAVFDAHVFEALRFNPITTFQLRTAEADGVLAAGTKYAASVKAGSLIAVATGSAMFDPALMPDPETFNPARPMSTYLHFGLGHHECLGRHVSRVAIPEAVRQIARLPQLRRAQGAHGQIDFSNGPFPEHFHIQWRRLTPATRSKGSSAQNTVSAVVSPQV